MQTCTCLNCGAVVTANFCAYCGQKATVKKLTWTSLFEEFLHFFTHAEHSFVYTSKKLVTHPGLVVKEFLDGKRVKVHKPVTFLLIWAAILKLFDSLLNYLTIHFHLYTFEKTHATLRILYTGAKNKTLTSFENFITILILGPILVFVGWLVFRKTKTSFVENWVAILYGTTFTIIISIPMVFSSFLFRLMHFRFTTGFINDYYFTCYFLAILWVIYSFEKVYRPATSRLLQFSIAVVLALFANYASDLVWYFLYWLAPA